MLRGVFPPLPTPFTDDALDRPIVGILSTASDFNPCHKTAPQVAEAISRGVRMAGALPFVFPTVSLHEAFSFGIVRFAREAKPERQSKPFDIAGGWFTEDSRRQGLRQFDERAVVGQRQRLQRGVRTDAARARGIRVGRVERGHERVRARPPELRVHSAAVALGPLLLRDFGLRPEKEHKRKAIEDILATYPKLKFILIGDSGEEDPEIYSAVVHRHPDRIRAVYIRSVNQKRISQIEKLAGEVAKTGCQLVLAKEAEQAAAHAAAEGLIQASELRAVRADSDSDRSSSKPAVSSGALK